MFSTGFLPHVGYKKHADEAVFFYGKYIYPNFERAESFTQIFTQRITRMAEIWYSKRLAHFSDSVMAAYISVTSEVASQTVDYTGRYFSWQLRIIQTITAQVFMYLGQYP